jgi:hypothetical protein
MENMYARRNFLKNAALASSGILFLSSTTMVRAFENQCPFEGYNPYSEDKTDSRVSSLFGNHVVIKGKVFDKMSLKEVSTAKVEVWHLSPNSTSYGHQAKMKVTPDGEFNFITDFPNRETGKFPKVYFKVTSNDKVYFTELSLTADNAFINNKHFEENLVLGKNLLPTNRLVDNVPTITFNIAV